MLSAFMQRHLTPLALMAMPTKPWLGQSVLTLHVQGAFKEPAACSAEWESSRGYGTCLCGLPQDL